MFAFLPVYTNTGLMEKSVGLSAKRGKLQTLSCRMRVLTLILALLPKVMMEIINPAHLIREADG